MAQLSDDIFAFGGALMSIEEAERLMAARLPPATDIETVSLADAIGRVLADDLISRVDLPPADNSAVDGYAVRFDDLDPDRETRLPVAHADFAGSSAARHIEPLPAVRNFTGATMPSGAAERALGTC